MTWNSFDVDAAHFDSFPISFISVLDLLIDFRRHLLNIKGSQVT